MPFRSSQRFGLLDFCDHEGLGARGVKKLAELPHVIGRADEREGHVVHVEAQREVQVAQVLFGERGDGDRNARDVQALVCVDDTADHDGAQDTAPFDFIDAKTNAPVVDQDVVARPEDLRENRRAHR